MKWRVTRGALIRLSRLRFPAAIATGFLLAGAWVGCSQNPFTSDDEPSGPEERVSELRVTGWPAVYWAGMSIPIEVEARDSDGVGVAGATIDFALTNDGGVLSATSLVTGSTGRAEVEIEIGRAGPNDLTATVHGRQTSTRWHFEALVRPRVWFARDSVRLAGTGCREMLYAQVLDEHDQLILASSVVFEKSNPELLSHYSPSATGTYRGMMMGIVAERAGTTSVIATHASGAADTIVVTVDPDVVSAVSIVEADEQELGDYPLPELASPYVGDTLRWGAWTGNECGRYVPVPVEWASTNAAVAAVEGDGTVTIGEHGHALIIASAAGLADTVKVETLQVEPRDTTIAAGDTVHYRMSVSDAAGVLHPVTDFWAQPGAEEVASPVMEDGKPSPRVVGIGPGTSQVWITASQPYRSAFVTLTVSES